jgi:hypothetical protein
VKHTLHADAATGPATPPGPTDSYDTSLTLAEAAAICDPGLARVVDRLLPAEEDQ